VNQHNPCALVIMPLFMFLAIFFQNHYLGNLSLFPNYFIYPKQEPRFIFETKLLSKLSISKIIGTYKVEWSHYFTNLYFVGIIKGFQTPLEIFLKEMFMSPLVSEKSTKALLYLKPFLNLTMA
jgi:hypothetical protein